MARPSPQSLCPTPATLLLHILLCLAPLCASRISAAAASTWHVASLGRTIHVFNHTLCPDILVLTSQCTLARLDPRTAHLRWRLAPPLAAAASPLSPAHRHQPESPPRPLFAAAVAPALAHPPVLLVLLSDRTLRAVHAATAATLWHVPACRLGVPRPSAVPVTTCDGATRWLHPVTGVRLPAPHAERNGALPALRDELAPLPRQPRNPAMAAMLRWRVADGATLVSDPDGTLRLVEGHDEDHHSREVDHGRMERWRRHDGLAHVADGAIFAPRAHPPAVVILSRLGALYALEHPGAVRWKLPLLPHHRCSLLHALAHTAVVVCTSSTVDENEHNDDDDDVGHRDDGDGEDRVDAQSHERQKNEAEVATHVTAVRVADGTVVFAKSLHRFRADRAALDDCCGRGAICVSAVDRDGRETRIAECILPDSASTSSKPDTDTTVATTTTTTTTTSLMTATTDTNGMKTDNTSRRTAVSFMSVSPSISRRGWILYTRGGREVRGVRGGATVWRLPMPTDATVAAVVTYRPPHPVASRLRPPAVRVTGFRTLLRKFVDENVALVLAEDAPAAEVHAMVVDARSGSMYNAITHTNAHAPVAGVRGDNWFVYTFWSETMLQQEVHVIDMYHRTRNTSWVGGTLRIAVRALFGDEIMAAFGIPDPDHVPPCQPPNGTLLDDQQCMHRTRSDFAQAAEQVLPVLKRSSSIMTQRVVALDVTETLLGITESSVIMTLESGQVSLVSKMLLDARRPKTATPQHMAEMLMPYKPVLSLESSARQSNYFADGLHVPGVRKVVVAPCRERESTTQIAVLGMDVVYSLMQPAGSFDALPEDFVYSAVVAMMVFLAGGVFYSHKLKMRSSLSKSW